MEHGEYAVAVYHDIKIPGNYNLPTPIGQMAPHLDNETDFKKGMHVEITRDDFER